MRHDRVACFWLDFNFDRKRMNAPDQVCPKGRMHRPVTCDPGHGTKSVGFETHPEVTLPARLVACMTDVLITFVQHFQHVRAKSRLQFGADFARDFPFSGQFSPLCPSHCLRNI